MLTYADVCSSMLTYAEVQSANEAAVAALTRAFESERHALVLRVASLERQVLVLVCSRMLTCAGVC
jgi:hypothetical protein